MMKPTTKLALAAASALAASVVAPSSASAQSVDTLLDKLVEKGVLTTKEAQVLREESDKDFTRAYQSKSGLPDWVTSLRLGGDVRLRYDGIYQDPPAGTLPTFTDRNRIRYRLRVGVTATMQDDFEVGMRLTSAENKAAAGATPAGDPISGNDTMTGNGSKKLVWIDLAYAKFARNRLRWTGRCTLDGCAAPRRASSARRVASNSETLLARWMTRSVFSADSPRPRRGVL